MTVCDENGDMLPELEKAWISKDAFLRDTEKLTSMIVDGPLSV